jgi:hypothetical protein
VLREGAFESETDIVTGGAQGIGHQVTEGIWMTEDQREIRRKKRRS